MTIHEKENGNFQLSGKAEISLEQLHKLEAIVTNQPIIIFTLPGGKTKYKANTSREVVAIKFCEAQ